MPNDLVPLGGAPGPRGELAPAQRVIERSGAAARDRILEFFTARIRNAHTRKTYAHAVREFLEFADAQGFERLQDVNPVLVAGYVESLKASDPTKKVHLSALRHFFDWLVTGHVIPTSPAASVRGPKYSATEGTTPAFEVKQVRKLRASIDTSNVVGLRDLAAISVLTYTACRVGAVAKLRLKHFAPEGSQWVLRLSEKRGKSRKIPVRHDLQELLEEYLKAAGIQGDDKETPFFRSAIRKTKTLSDRPMTGKDILRMVKRRLKDVGLPDNFSCHSFRATTITDLLEQGVPLEDVQYLAGHADSRTTKLYSRKKQEVTRNIVERISI